MYENLKTTRRRRSLGDLKVGGVEQRPSGPRDNYTTLVQTQFTESEGHPVSLLGKTRDDIGGPFFTAKATVTGGNFNNVYRTNRPGYSYQYTGNLVPAYAIQFLNTFASEAKAGTLQTFLSESQGVISTKSQLEALGTTAIANCNPAKQMASAAVALKELYTEGLPKIPGVSRERLRQVLSDFRQRRASGAFKGSAEEYLNIVFGWSPLINDVSDIYTSAKNFELFSTQFLRDAGRVVRRSYGFPDLKRPAYSVVTSDVTGVTPGGLPTGDYASSSPNENSLHRTSKSERWFEGAFTYYVPKGDDFISSMRRRLQVADHLFGVAPTPETVWNATPWSWAVDWFSNAGDVLSNISDMLLDGSVLHYGYMMEKSIIKYQYSSTGTVLYGNTGRPTYTVEITVEVKQRIRATPFGFGVSFDSLTTKQRLIAAALGITRLR